MSIEEARKLVEIGIRRGLIIPPHEIKRDVKPPKLKTKRKIKRSPYGKRGPYKKKSLQSAADGANVSQT